MHILKTGSQSEFYDSGWIHNKKGGINVVKNEIKYKKGMVLLVDLGCREGSVEYGVRPVVILGNASSNTYSPAITVAPLSTSIAKIKKGLPTHVYLSPLNSDVRKESVIMLEQILTIDKSWVIKPLFELSDDLLHAVDMSLLVQLGILNKSRMAMAV